MKLLVFTRYPEPGRVKTRLIPAVGKEGACNLHRKMVEHTIKSLHCFGEKMEIRFDGGEERLMRQWLGEGFLYRAQGDGDLGNRLECTFAEVFLQGERKVIAVGTDCPGLSEDYVRQATYLLNKVDLVLGPAVDGGYYLIGMRVLHRNLFKNISWGSNKVLQQTLLAAEKLQLTTALLDELVDVDRPEDLIEWKKRRRNE
jgi:rSAM/selenodomain-associated transferase 1